jgi:hypothetical protein
LCVLAGGTVESVTTWENSLKRHTERNPMHPDTRRFAGCLFISCRGDARRKPGRASARRVCTMEFEECHPAPPQRAKTGCAGGPRRRGSLSFLPFTRDFRPRARLVRVFRRCFVAIVAYFAVDAWANKR